MRARLFPGHPRAFLLDRSSLRASAGLEKRKQERQPKQQHTKVLASLFMPFTFDDNRLPQLLWKWTSLWNQNQKKKALLVFVSKKTLGFAHSYKDTFSSFFLPLTILVFVALGEVFDLLCLHSRPAQCHKAHKVHLEYIVSQLRQHMNVVEEH